MPAEKNLPLAVQNTAGVSLDELHPAAVDTAVNLAKQLGGDGFNNMAADKINALIDAHQLTDKALEEMTKPPRQDEGEEKEKGKKDKGPSLGRLATMVRMATELQRTTLK